MVPDQHAAFGITRATQAKREPIWKELGLAELVQRGPGEVVGGPSAVWGAGITGRDGNEGSSSGSANELGLGRGMRQREGLAGGLPR